MQHLIPIFLSTAAWLLLWFIPLFGLFWVINYFFSMPLRRQERSQFFLDLLETGLRQGRSPEQTVTQIAQTGDASAGPHFHLLAAHIQSGLCLGDALARTSRMVLPQIAAMLMVGEKIGDVRRVIPACRGLLKDANSQMLGASNYMMLSILAGTPILPATFVVLKVCVIPKFRDIFAGYALEIPQSLAVLDLAAWIAVIQAIIILLFLVNGIAYLDGPFLKRWAEAGFAPVTDWIIYSLPWRRKRLLRDFSAMLALLLDADVPEARAIQLAAQSTANRVMQARSVKAVADLEAGRNLAQALRRFNDADEFGWRLANASHGERGFAASLAGWMQALDAKAFQQEQTASQTLSTLLVLVNGLLVGLVAYGVFSLLTGLMNVGVLW